MMPQIINTEPKEDFSNMTLGDMRRLFTKLICEHVLWVNENSPYEVAFDEVTERITEKDLTSDHMKNSVHHNGLAADLLFYLNKRYITTTEAHLFSGIKWEGRHQLCRWGGRFKRPDGNHYSFEYQGRR